MRSYCPDGHEDVKLDLESLQIDTAQNCCSLVWRGQLALEHESRMSVVQLMGGVSASSGELDWFDPFERKDVLSTPGTMALDSRAILAAATPFLKTGKTKKRGSLTSPCLLYTSDAADE